MERRVASLFGTVARRDERHAAVEDDGAVPAVERDQDVVGDSDVEDEESCARGADVTSVPDDAAVKLFLQEKTCAYEMRQGAQRCKEEEKKKSCLGEHHCVGPNRRPQNSEPRGTLGHAPGGLAGAYQGGADCAQGLWDDG